MIPEIAGRAWLTGMGEYLLDPDPLPRVRPLSGYEVAVVGAGIVGCATAFELASRGVRVCLIDRGSEISSGTTGLGEGNVLCCDEVPGPELDLAMHGLAAYDQVRRLLGVEAGITRRRARHPRRSG